MHFRRKIKFQDDLGFSSNPLSKSQRMLNPDGKPNVIKTGLSRLKMDDTFTRLVTMNWLNFFLIIIGIYMLINVLFAFLYTSIGIDNFVGAEGKTARDHFFDAFFFSAQTISTVGYGHIAPRGFVTSLIAAFESMLGLLAFALATGLLYGRFSRPTSKIKFSKEILISPYHDGFGLMCRFVNFRKNHLIEVEAEMYLSYNEMVEGKLTRKFYPLALERSQISILALSWTLVHPINEDSPLFNKTLKELHQAEVEFMVLLKAFDENFSQTIHSRTSYHENQILDKVKFKKMFFPNEDGKIILDYSLLNEVEPSF